MNSVSLSGGKYSQVLSSLEDIRKLSGGSLDLPQICVIGDQSSGKSSLLSSIIGVNGILPEGSGIVTKCPIIVQLENDETESFFVQGTADDSSVISDESSVDSEASEASEPLEEYTTDSLFAKNTADDSSVDSDKSNHGSFVFVPNSDNDWVHYSTVEEASKAISKQQSQNLKGQKVSKTPVMVKYCGPRVPNLVIVDLPGIIHSGEGVKEVKENINAFIKPEQTLILVVRTADGEAETQLALELASRVDPSRERTLVVHTKCDVFSSAANQTRTQRLLTDAQKGGASLRAHGVCCRRGGDETLSDDQEKNLLQETFPHLTTNDGLTPVLGVTSLSSRLANLLAERVRSNIPTLETAMRTKLKDAESTLKRLGEHAKDSGTLLTELRDHLQQVSPRLEKELSSHMTVFQEQVRKTKDLLTEEWTDERFHPSVFKPPFFQGRIAFDECTASIGDMWRPILDGLVEDCGQVLGEKGMQLGNTNCSRSLKEGCVHSWGQVRETLIQRLEENVQQAVKNEARFGTMNHYLTSKFQEKMIVPETVITEFAENFNSTDFRDLYQAHTDDAQAQLRDVLRSTLEEHFAEFARKSLAEQTKHRLHCAVQAHWCVEHKTFIDLVLKLIQSDVLDTWNEWVAGIMQDEVLRPYAKEEVSVVRERQDALEMVSTMNACIRKIESIKMCS